jgi:cyanophycinase-like exopeptidase
MNVRFIVSVAVGAVIVCTSPVPKASAQQTPASTPCAMTVFPRYGTFVPTPKLHGPGLVLAGGGFEESPPSIFPWIRRTITGTDTGRGGNIVVLRASSANEYDSFFYHDGRFASVQTLLIPSCAPAADLARAARIVDTADAVFFAGGDQAHYVAWKGSPLIDAVKRVYARGGVVGGGSAGLAIQGAVIFDSVAGDRFNANVHSADAIADPFEPRISFTTGLFAWPALRNTMTDTHFAIRNRFGRAVVFLARIAHDGLMPGASSLYALGIDHASAVVVDAAGTGTLLNAAGGRGAYLVRAPATAAIAPQRPFQYTVMLSHVKRNFETFDVAGKTTQDPWFAITVRAGTMPYSRNPYDL